MQIIPFHIFHSSVTIRYNKLHAEPSQGKTLDLILKKVKHRFVENMSSSTADALGLSRAILCNDSLLKRLEDLKRCEGMYRGLVEVQRVYHYFFFLPLTRNGCRYFSQLGSLYSTQDDFYDLIMTFHKLTKVYTDIQCISLLSN